MEHGMIVEAWLVGGPSLRQKGMNTNHGIKIYLNKREIASIEQYSGHKLRLNWGTDDRYSEYVFLGKCE